MYLKAGKPGKNIFSFFLPQQNQTVRVTRSRRPFYLRASDQKVEIFMKLLHLNKDTDKLKLKPVLGKFTSYCNPGKNIAILCHKFFTYKQVEGQSFNDFVTELKKCGSECEFGDLTTSLTKDIIFVA